MTEQKRWFERKIVFIVLLALAFTPIAYYGSQVSRPDADENVYYYQAKLVTEGQIPYRDFFLSHPPLFIYLTALAIKILGNGYITLKIIPLTAAFTVLVLTYLLGEHIKKGVGVASCILILLYSHTFHSISHTMLGIMTTTALTLAAYILHTKKQTKASGFITAIACFTRLNATPILIYLSIRSILGKDKKFFKGMLFTLPLLTLLLIPNFIEDVILYRMKEDPESLRSRLVFLYLFTRAELPIVALTVVAIIGVIRRYLKEPGKATKSWMLRDTELNLTLLPVFFIVFTMLFQRRITLTYFMLIIPYLAIAASISLKEIAGPIRKNFKTVVKVSAICIILTSYFMYFPAGVIANAYRSPEIKTLSSATEYVRENTKAGENVLFIQYGGGPKIALDTDTKIAGNLIAPTMHLVYAYKDTFNTSLVNALKDNPVLVTLELRMLQMMINQGIDVTEVLRTLGMDYWPTKVIPGGREIDTLIVWTRKDEVDFSATKYLEGGEKYKRYYLGRYYFKLNGRETIEDYLLEDDDYASQPFISPQLTGDNIFKAALIVNKTLIKWPLKENTNYVVAGEDNMSTQVWVSQVRGNGIRLTALTWWDAGEQKNLISLTEIEYDTHEKEFTKITCYSRLGHPLSDYYRPTYQQILLTEEQYKKIITEN